MGRTRGRKAGNARRQPRLRLRVSGRLSAKEKSKENRALPAKKRPFFVFFYKFFCCCRLVVSGPFCLVFLIPRFLFV